MTATAVFIGMAVIVSILIGLALWMVVDINRINRHPEDDYYPVSRRQKGDWDE